MKRIFIVFLFIIPVLVYSQNENKKKGFSILVVDQDNPYIVHIPFKDKGKEIFVEMFICSSGSNENSKLYMSFYYNGLGYNTISRKQFEKCNIVDAKVILGVDASDVAFDKIEKEKNSFDVFKGKSIKSFCYIVFKKDIKNKSIKLYPVSGINVQESIE